MRRMTKDSILRKLDAEMKKLAKVRDELRDLKDDVEDQYERANESADLLQAAIERISEAV